MAHGGQVGHLLWTHADTLHFLMTAGPQHLPFF